MADLKAEGQKALGEIDALEGNRVDQDPQPIIDRAKVRTKIAQLMSRGVVNDKLNIQLKDPNWTPYWIRERPEDIERFKALGGRKVAPDQTVGNASSLHGSETDTIRVGDVILMALPTEVSEVIAEVREEQKQRLLGRAVKEFEREGSKDIPHVVERG